MKRLILGLLFLTGGYTHAADRPDLNKIERHIAKEPVYKFKQQLYGLYAFGPEAKTWVWAVFDKSKPDASDYDILYFDRNADGDLTAPEERIAGKVKEGQMTFDIGSFTDPVTKQKHTKMSITWSGNLVDYHIVGLNITWCDKVKIWCQNAQFAATPAQAPVLWPGADGPLSFLYYSQHKRNIGEAEDVTVQLGHPGHGRGSTFSAVYYDFLQKEVPIRATLLYTDKEGKERRAQAELRERC
jgi:hypothetical protein